jgi:hypothetical protein
MEIFNDTIGSRTRDLPTCSAVPLICTCIERKTVMVSVSHSNTACGHVLTRHTAGHCVYDPGMSTSNSTVDTIVITARRAQSWIRQHAATFHRKRTGSVPEHFIWDFWYTQRRWGH